MAWTRTTRRRLRSIHGQYWSTFSAGCVCLCSTSRATNASLPTSARPTGVPPSPTVALSANVRSSSRPTRLVTCASDRSAHSFFATRGLYPHPGRPRSTTRRSRRVAPVERLFYPEHGHASGVPPGALPHRAQPGQGHVVPVVAQPVHGVRPPVHASASSAPSSGWQTAHRTTATARRSASRRTSSSNSGESWAGRRGSTSRSRSAPRRTRTSPPRAGGA